MIGARIKIAEGYLELGLHEEAWNTLDELKYADQLGANVLALRVRILVAAKSWIKAEIFASTLVAAMPSFALGWYLLAQAFAQQGNMEAAKTALTRACEVEETLKFQALQDELLAHLW